MVAWMIPWALLKTDHELSIFLRPHYSRHIVAFVMLHVASESSCVGCVAGGAMCMTLDKPDYARVKRAVRELHKEFGVTEPPVDPIRIARGLGLIVYFVVFELKKKNVSGFFDYTENAIFVNKEEYPLRQTFTIAHELGHKVLHEDWAKSSDYCVLLRDSDYDAGEPHEKEANAFAAHLLVPRFLLDKYYDRLTLEQLSTIFAVSVPMILVVRTTIHNWTPCSVALTNFNLV
jgi:Zn-dependent peptidase ImmA (M78 family)